MFSVARLCVIQECNESGSAIISMQCVCNAAHALLDSAVRHHRECCSC